jgi:hypothetical protein
MNVEQTKRTLIGLPPRKSVLLESNHGLGKSEIVRQVAAYLSQIMGKPFGLIDFRLAQCEVADVIGMMRHVDAGEVTHVVYKDGKKDSETRTIKNVTVHDFAEWFPQDPDSCGFLFLDELFRAPRDLQNAVMELALDYRYHFKELPIGWRVIAASNDNMDVYNGIFPDPALYDRFLKIKFKPTVPEWLSYARGINVHPAIIQYISKITADLMPENIEPGKVCPSPRSWISLSDCIKYMAENNDDPLNDLDYLYLLAQGYLGDAITVNFVEYIKKNYKIFSGEDILNKWKEKNLEQEFSQMLVPELGFYHTEIIRYIKNKEKLTSKQSINLLAFIQTIPKESASGFFAQFCNECRNIATTWYNTPGVRDYIYGFLNRSKALK